jgi:hypothetical protein
LIPIGFIFILGRLIYKVLNSILEPLEYKYVGEFYKIIVDKILVVFRGIFSIFNYRLLISFNLSLPKNIYAFSVRRTGFFDGNLLKYLQIFILAIIFFYILGLISF